MSPLPRPRWLTPALSTGAAVTLAYALWSLLDPPADGAPSVPRIALYTLVGFGSAAAVLARARRPGTGSRPAWGMLGGTLLLWAVADLSGTLVYGNDLPAFSFADPLYLVGYPPLVVGLLVLRERRRRSWRSGLWLDGAAGALALAALGAMTVLVPVRAGLEGDGVDVVLTLAYPACDVLVIAALVAATALREWRQDLRWLLLSAGVLGFAVGDAVYAVEAADGTYLGGGLLDVTWLLMSLCFAAAAWTDAARVPLRGSGAAVVFAPAVIGTAALGLLLADTTDGPDPVTATLAAAAILAVLARSALAIADTHRVLAHARTEASTDALTSLGNRRRLMIDLARHVQSRDAMVLVILDLDGFKGFNDTRGHEAGDRLLARIGATLGTLTSGSGAAYRLGGDEFCVLLPATDEHDALTATARVGAAVESVGDPDGVGVSSGHALLPQEGWDAATALRIADVRMYAVKRGDPLPPLAR